MNRPDVSAISGRFFQLSSPFFASKAVGTIASGMIHDAAELVRWIEDLEKMLATAQDQHGEANVKLGELRAELHVASVNSDAADAKILELETDLARTRRIIAAQGW